MTENQISDVLESEYISLRQQRRELIEKRDNIERVETIDRGIEKLRQEREAIMAKFDMPLTICSNKLREIEDKFKSMYAGDKKISSGRIELSFSSTKSFKVIDPKSIIDTLVAINQIDKGVKSFSLTHLRKLAVADVLDSNAYEFNEQINMKINIK